MERKELRWTRMALICAAALAIFSVAVHQVKGHMTELDAQEDSLTSQLNSLKQRQDELMVETAQVGTESYIENRARLDYQYVKPGELRFEIINPDALYDVTDEDLAQAIGVAPSPAP